jgi:DNA (cytosine-5)-methyltransferase 1
MIKLFEMFSGYGGASFALQKAGIEFECVGISEIDKYAVQCYNQNFPNIKNYGDCKLIEPNDLPEFDLLTGGFPCQSFSLAGKGLGELDPRGTLFYEIIRIAEVKQPKYMLLENVKGLTTKSHKATFDKIISEIKRIGYEVIYKVLNSKDFGIPQNRERIWFVCIRNDIYKPFEFKFPEKEELKLLLRDILEEEVEDKYYLNSQTVKRLLNDEKGFRSKINSEIGSCLFSSQYKVSRGIDLINTNKSNYEMSNRVYNPEGIIPTLSTAMGTGGGNVPCVLSCALRSYPRTNNPERDKEIGRFQNLEIGKEFSNTISSVQKDSLITNSSFIRKLTPKECFRLMGFLNDEINLNGLSDTQKYKLAGNGWEISVASKILKNMFKEE